METASFHGAVNWELMAVPLSVWRKSEQAEKWTSSACTWIYDIRPGHGSNATHRCLFKGQCIHRGLLSTCLIVTWDKSFGHIS